MITLEKDWYDRLEAASEQYGGIGAFAAYDSLGQPCCIAGYISALLDADEESLYEFTERTWPFGSMALNDEAVGQDGRIPWPEYCRRRGIVRAES